MMAAQGQLPPPRRVYTGMPVYNGERYVEQSLRSNLSQTFDDFGVIVSDNASTDRTQEICRDIAASDPRVHYIRNEINLGASKNYTACFEPARCEYFRWSNADDLIEPTLIERCVAVLDDHPDVVLAYGKTRLIDEHGELIRHYDDNLHLPQADAAERFIACRQSMGLSNVLYGLMRRDRLAMTNLLGNYRASDINLIAELTLYGRFFEIREPLFSRRMHPEASSWDRADDDGQKDFWDPSQARLLMQRWRSDTEYFKAVRRAPIEADQKRRIRAWLRRKMMMNRRILAGELFDYLRYKLSPKRWKLEHK